MKKYLFLLLGGSLLVLDVALAQPVGVPPVMSAPEGYALVKLTNSLPRFDLDFPGGTPGDLVKAVEKAIHKPLNAIIPDDCADLKISAASVRNITVAQLFEALKLASKTSRRYSIIDPYTWNANTTDRTVTYGFQSQGMPNENSIWFFVKEGDDSGPLIPVAPTVCRFYQLWPYLENGYSVEDITTAVETAWKMLGVTKPPEISYHKDTTVLVAVGDADKVHLIGDVLEQLSKVKAKAKSSDKDLPKSKDQ